MQIIETGPPTFRLKIAERFAVPAGLLSGAMLLFALEPMIAKMILPWFGGSAAVWTSCLLFFQAALCGGYCYAHGSARFLSPGWQRLLHAALLLGSLLLLPISPAPGWQPAAGDAPLLRLCGLLLATIGMPFVLLSATSPLLQAWLIQAREAAGIDRPLPYRLFALSNAGSLAALLAYPILIEPLLATSLQALLWSAAYAGFVAVGLAAALLTYPGARAIAAPPVAEAAPVSGRDMALWLLLSAVPSLLLLAITGHITQNVAPMPLLWVAPLALYLISLVLCFDSPRWYNRKLFSIVFAELFLAMLYAALRNRANSDPLILLVIFASGLFVACMCCHGELAAMRPRGRHLTLFYLMVAIGGAIGGVLGAAIAPAVLPALLDMPIALSLAGLAVIIGVWRNQPPQSRQARLGFAASGLLWLTATLYVAYEEYAELHGDLLLARNFYGALRVIDEKPAAGPPVRRLMHGTISHGAELMDDARRCEPTTYYGRVSGVGLALAALQRQGPVTVSVVGLGAGTLAAYARPEDRFRFYEINPLVVEAARGYFDYLGGCGPPPAVTLGDARLSLENEPPQHDDLLVLDAFSGDAVPVHLLTREAFAAYWRQLKPDGVIAVHVSNQFVDLAPIVARAASLAGRESRVVWNEAHPEIGVFPAEWVLVTARAGFFDQPELQAARPIAVPTGLKAWTDDYSNLWHSLR